MGAYSGGLQWGPTVWGPTVSQLPISDLYTLTLARAPNAGGYSVGACSGGDYGARATVFETVYAYTSPGAHAGTEASRAGQRGR